MYKESRYDQYYIDMAHVTSTMSHDMKTKVGCLIVKNGQILSQGWNGMPAGMDNDMRCNNGHTRKEVIHSEANALMKLARNGGSSEDSTLYSTHSPCWECSKLILQAGIKRVVFSTVYDPTSWQFLKEHLGEENINGGVQPTDGLFVRQGTESKSE